MSKLFLIFSALFALIAPDVALAQQQLPAATQQTATIKRTVHPSSVFAYMMEGDYTFIPDGQPERTYRAGENFRIEPGVIHNAKSGATPSKLMVVFTVEKGKPLASPAQ